MIGRPKKLTLEQRMQARRFLRGIPHGQRTRTYDRLAKEWNVSRHTIINAVLG